MLIKLISNLISFLFSRTQEEHVLDLQLLACRKKFRGRGLGRHLVKVKTLLTHSKNHIFIL